MSGGGGQLQAPTLAAQAAQMQNAAYKRIRSCTAVSGFNALI